MRLMVRRGFPCWAPLQPKQTTEACSAFIENAGIIRQIRLPYTVYAVRMVWRALIVFLHNVVLIVPIALLFHLDFGFATLLVLPGLLPVILNQIWASIVIGIVATRFRDITQLVATGIQILMFVTPIMWPVSAISDAKLIAEVNPFYHLNRASSAHRSWDRWRNRCRGLWCSRCASAAMCWPRCCSRARIGDWFIGCEHGFNCFEQRVRSGDSGIRDRRQQLPDRLRSPRSEIPTSARPRSSAWVMRVFRAKAKARLEEGLVNRSQIMVVSSHADDIINPFAKRPFGWTRAALLHSGQSMMFWLLTKRLSESGLQVFGGTMSA